MIKKLKQKYQDHKVKRARKREERNFLLNQPSAYDEAVLSWISPETIKHERGLTWKILTSLFIALSLAWGIVYGSWTFSLAIFLFVIVYYLVHLEHPKDVEVKVSELGVKVGSRKYPYSRIKAFWILYEPHIRTLNLRVSGDVISDITIQLGHQHPAELRGFLMERIPELEGQSEKISDIFLRIFKI